MSSNFFIIGWWTMFVLLNAYGQAGTDGNGAADAARSNGVQQGLSSAPAKTNGADVNAQGPALGQHGAPPSRTNKFNSRLPANPPPVTGKPDRETNQSDVAATNQPGPAASTPAGSNGSVAVLPESVVWQYGAPTSRTNKFNPMLPTNAPPPVVDKHSPEMNSPERGTNQPGPETNQSGAVSKFPPATGSNSEPVVWQFGAPTSRTNKFNPALPTNLPPAVTNEK